MTLQVSRPTRQEIKPGLVTPEFICGLVRTGAVQFSYSTMPAGQPAQAVHFVPWYWIYWLAAMCWGTVLQYVAQSDISPARLAKRSPR